jgi:hypothetical protein
VEEEQAELIEKEVPKEEIQRIDEENPSTPNDEQQELDADYTE